MSEKNDYIQYDNPLITRYASPEMIALWGPRRKFGTWRRLWVALAEAEAELGLPITRAQIEQLRAHVDDIDFDNAERHEHRLRHDVMAHVHAYGDVCPDARAIIHLGATSCYVTDNTDLILLREGLEMIRGRVVAVIERLAEFAQKYRDLACLGFTHLQPAQPTTVGKRACLWAYDLVMDLAEIEHRLASLKALGSKGVTGTQASFLELFHGDHEKVHKLEKLICRKIGFDAGYAVSGQTYSRKIDSQSLAVLSGVAQSAHKMATDIRLLAHRKELEEPFEMEQIGSSAMAYKRNPMRCERICSLARFVMSLESSAVQTMAVQWLERTLDDSANRRLTLPAGIFGGRRRAHTMPERDRRAGGISEGDSRPFGGRIALYGQRKHPYGGRGRWRRPAGPARADPPPQPGRRGGGQRARRAKRFACPAGRRPGLFKSEPGRCYGAGEIRGPRPAAGGRVP